MSVISNTTVISNYACVKRLEFLKQLFQEIYISTDVYEEIQSGLEEGYSFYAGMELYIHPISPNGWIKVNSVSHQEEIDVFATLPRRLHRGEASCIAITQHRGWLFLTDDKTAREIADKYRVRVSGSIGCLILAVEKQLLSTNEANSLLQEMIRQGYRSPVDDLTKLI